MEANWISLWDTVVKIGLGSLITAISGYLVLLKNQQHENTKEEKAKFYERQNDRKSKYVAFMSQAQMLVQAYLHTNCSCDTEEYKNYLSIYGELQIIADDQVRLAAYNYHSAVNQFITAHKNDMPVQDKKVYRKGVNDTLGLFQKIANEDIVQIYRKHSQGSVLFLIFKKLFTKSQEKR